MRYHFCSSQTSFSAIKRFACCLLNATVFHLPKLLAHTKKLARRKVQHDGVVSWHEDVGTTSTRLYFYLLMIRPTTCWHYQLWHQLAPSESLVTCSDIDIREPLLPLTAVSILVTKSILPSVGMFIKQFLLGELCGPSGTPQNINQ